jgi:hypothetical protein
MPVNFGSSIHVAKIRLPQKKTKPFNMEKDTEAAWTDQIVLSSQQSPVEQKNK